MRVLKKDRLDSLGAEISEVQNFDCYDCFQQNPNKCIVQEDVHTYMYMYVGVAVCV